MFKIDDEPESSNEPESPKEGVLEKYDEPESPMRGRV